MTPWPPTANSEPAALLRRERPPALAELDGQLHLARLRCELAGVAAEPVLFREWPVVRRIGHGGMGSVYLARHRQLGCWVALKILHARGDRSAEMHDARLIREAQALATIDHPHVIKIHQIDIADAQTVIEIEYIDGETLRAWQAGRPLPPAAVYINPPETPIANTTTLH